MHDCEMEESRGWNSLGDYHRTVRFLGARFRAALRRRPDSLAVDRHRRHGRDQSHDGTRRSRIALQPVKKRRDRHGSRLFYAVWAAGA